ncbi:hypothetical protein BZA77DRAFT_317185 [Pyronema omphalodes]|nr:hypothetical protein BZA77DRAFT_317185 [Pyronema omphalodes]
MLPVRHLARPLLFRAGVPTRQVRFKAGGKPQAQYEMPKMPAQPSTRVQLKQHMEIPADMGLIDGTFVMPTGSNLPSLFTSLRWVYEKARLKQRFFDTRDKFVYMWYGKNRLGLSKLLEPKKVAGQLYVDMYTAFTRGDLKKLQTICGEGLFDSFRQKLFARRGKITWEHKGFVTKPKLVSNKLHHYPTHNLDRRQAVVRIHSKQQLKKWNERGELVKDTGDSEVVEYLVLEQKKVDGIVGPWFIWGTTKETKVTEDGEIIKQ